MRRRLQQGCSQLVTHLCASPDRGAWVVAIIATAIYLLTMDRSLSWWDCGEFIATGWTLGIGHPPGTPFYQIVTHTIMLLSFGHTEWVASLSNAVSALCSGTTVGLLYATMRMAGLRRLPAWIGSLCYLFCDTAWFSAVESEVYAMAMLVCSWQAFLALKMKNERDLRYIPLMGLTAGIGICVHLMTLLSIPAVAVIVLWHRPWTAGRAWWRAVVLAAGLFLVGLSPYAIVPIRAAAHPAINELGDGVLAYFQREQYEKAPLYPRMWRERDAENWADWNAGRIDVVGNAVYYATYQLGYMYLRYVMYNFGGRENLNHHRVVVFIIPLLLGIIGLVYPRWKHGSTGWMVALLFLFGGPLLNLYLNHPCYEPRSRDYVYILSFYAFCFWIAAGTQTLLWWVESHTKQRQRRRNVVLIACHLLLIAAPFSMMAGNWSDHDRHRCHSVHDIAYNHLACCDSHAILITLGDNDTFPLWYLQQVEGIRRDVTVLNVGLTKWSNIMDTLRNNQGQRPVYFSHYFYQRYSHLFAGHLRCEGFCWRLMLGDNPDLSPITPYKAQWFIGPKEYLDPISKQFVNIWRTNTGSMGANQRL